MELVAQRTGDLDARGIGNACWALASIARSIQDGVEEGAEGGAQTASTAALLAAARRCVSLLLAEPAAQPRPLVVKDGRDATPAGALNAQQLSNALWAACVLGTAAEGRGRQWAAPALAAASQGLAAQAFVGHGVVQLLHAASTLQGHVPLPHGFLPACRAELLRQAGQLTARTAGTALVHLARLSHHDALPRREPAEGANSNGSGPSPRDSLGPRGPAADGGALDGYWLGALLEATASALGDADGMALANTAWAVASLVTGRDPHADAGAACRECSGSAGLSRSPPAAWLGALYSSLQRRGVVTGLGDAELCQLLWALAALDQAAAGGLVEAPPQGLLLALGQEVAVALGPEAAAAAGEQPARRRQQRRLSAQGLAMAGWGLSRLLVRAVPAAKQRRAQVAGAEPSQGPVQAPASLGAADAAASHTDAAVRSRRAPRSAARRSVRVRRSGTAVLHAARAGPASRPLDASVSLWLSACAMHTTHGGLPLQGLLLCCGAAEAWATVLARGLRPRRQRRLWRCGDAWLRAVLKAVLSPGHAEHRPTLVAALLRVLTAGGAARWPLFSVAAASRALARLEEVVEAAALAAAATTTQSTSWPLPLLLGAGERLAASGRSARPELTRAFFTAAMRAVQPAQPPLALLEPRAHGSPASSQGEAGEAAGPACGAPPMVLCTQDVCAVLSAARAWKAAPREETIEALLAAPPQTAWRARELSQAARLLAACCRPAGPRPRAVAPPSGDGAAMAAGLDATGSAGSGLEEEAGELGVEGVEAPALTPSGAMSSAAEEALSRQAEANGAQLPILQRGPGRPPVQAAAEAPQPSGSMDEEDASSAAAAPELPYRRPAAERFVLAALAAAVSSAPSGAPAAPPSAPALTEPGRWDAVRVARVALAAVRLRLSVPARLRHGLAAWLEAALHGAPPATAVRLLWCCARLGVRLTDPRRQLEGLWARHALRPEALAARHAVAALSAVAHMRVLPPAHWVQQVPRAVHTILRELPSASGSAAGLGAAERTRARRMAPRRLDAAVALQLLRALRFLRSSARASEAQVAAVERCDRVYTAVLRPRLRAAVRVQLIALFGPAAAGLAADDVAAPPPGAIAPRAAARATPRARLAALLAAQELGLLTDTAWRSWAAPAAMVLAQELPPGQYPQWLALLARLGSGRLLSKAAAEDLLLAFCLASAQHMRVSTSMSQRPAVLCLQPQRSSAQGSCGRGFGWLRRGSLHEPSTVSSRGG
jgi:hypothetical protein